MEKHQNIRNSSSTVGCIGILSTSLVINSKDDMLEVVLIYENKTTQILKFTISDD